METLSDESKKEFELFIGDAEDYLKGYVSQFHKNHSLGRLMRPEPNDGMCKAHAINMTKDLKGVRGLSVSVISVEKQDFGSPIHLEHIGGGTYQYHFVVEVARRDMPETLILDPYLPENFLEAIPKSEYMSRAYSNGDIGVWTD